MNLPARSPNQTRVLAVAAVCIVYGLYVFTREALTMSGWHSSTYGGSDLHRAAYMEVWRNQTVSSKPFGGISEAAPLILITPQMSMGYEFFTYLFRRAGVPFTGDVDANWTMAWGNTAFPEKRYSDQRMTRMIFFDPICSKSGLCDSLWRSTAKIYGDRLFSRIEDTEFTPPCFVLPGDWRKLIRYSDAREIPLFREDSKKIHTFQELVRRRVHEPPTWIMKLDSHFGGNGLALMHAVSDVVAGRGECLTSKQEPEALIKKHNCTIPEAVVQKFVRRSLLIEGRRTLIRFYVLIDSLNPLRVFISRIGYVAISTVAEDKTRSSKMNPLCPWIVNTIFQSSKCERPIDDLAGDDSVERYAAEGQDIPLDDRSSPFTWSTVGLFDYLRDSRPDLSLKKVWRSVRRSVGRAVLFGYPYLKGRLAYLPRTDQNLLGVDVILGEGGEATVVEVNCHPGMATRGHLLFKVKERVFADMIKMTGQTQYTYPPQAESLALERVDQFCGSLVAGCTAKMHMNLRDTELMLMHRGSFDIVAPSIDLLNDYRKILTGSTYGDDHLLAAYIRSRDEE